MKAKIVLPLVIITSTALGGAAGYLLRPESDVVRNDETNRNSEIGGPSEFIKLPNQFIVPMVVNGHVASLVIMSISLEVAQGSSEQVFQHEPRLRDNLLQALFDHANTGGFRGNFTSAENLASLRRQLQEVSAHILGDVARNVLITEIVRQDE